MITALLSLSILIIYHYNKYNQVEDRINTAYSASNFQSSTLYKLFSTFSEADYIFRMYAINFKDEDYNLYRHKLDSVKIVIDSLASIPISNKAIKQKTVNDLALTTEYLLLKKQVDHLVIYAKDTMAYIVDIESKNALERPNIQLLQPDSIIKSILNDTSLYLTDVDPNFNSKESIFKRVFTAKKRSLIPTDNPERYHSDPADITFRNNLEKLITHNKNIYNDNLNQLKANFEKLQAKERQLLFANFTLLNSLKIGIERLRNLEFDNYKKNQETDFLLYNKNTKTIRNQLIAAISLMILMIILIIGYQRQVYYYELKLIKEKDYADKIAEEKTSVLANISHEIRTPLNSLKGLVNILKNNNSANLIDKEIIHSVDHDITIINSTINDILSLSKLESESLQIINDQINIYNLIEDVIALHTYQAKTKKLQLNNINRLPISASIYSNSFRIKQLLSNLISNAIKYTDKGHINVISEIINKDTLIVKVEDTGIGISKEHSDQVFRKYYIAENKGKTGGFGLGLYISKILSEQIGGKLYFESTIACGTTFTFELPLSSIKQHDLDKITIHKIQEIPESIHIVFIDDSKINLFFIQQLFRDKKNINLFLDVSTAHAYIKNNHTDIVITDIHMPRITGWEILNIIKEDENLKHIKVFAHTADPLLIEDKKNKYQFDGVINKPIDEDDLVYTIMNT